MQGLYLSFVYLRTKNIAVSIGVHCIYNIVNVILIIFTI
ncbi:CPBP family glutamic-type intramembrane protease [[Clostridium] polysaccharolyticum]